MPAEVGWMVPAAGSFCVGAQVMGCAQWANLDGIDGPPTGLLLRASTGAKSQSECQHGATERSKFKKKCNCIENSSYLIMDLVHISVL